MKVKTLTLLIISVYSVALLSQTLELLPFTIFFLSLIAIKRKANLDKLIVSLTLPLIYFFPFNLWVDMKLSWYLIPVSLTALILFSFFKISEKIIYAFNKHKKSSLLSSIILTLTWVSILYLSYKILGTEPTWMFFSYRWFKSNLAQLNIYSFESIVFFTISYFSISLTEKTNSEKKRWVHISLSTILIIILLLSFLKPIKIEHPQKALLINLNLDFSYTHRVENQKEILYKYIEAIKNSTSKVDFIILPEYVIVTDWRKEPKIIELFKNTSSELNTPILVGSKEDINTTHFYNVAVIFDKNKSYSVRDVFPMSLSKNTVKGNRLPTIDLKNNSYAVLLCFSSTQSKIWKEIKENPKIDGVLVLANEQALHWFLKKDAYYLIRYFEVYSKKPVYKATNQGITYP